MGQQIATLVNMKQTSGHHQTEWHPFKGNSRCTPTPNGIYFYRLSVEAANYHNDHVGKMMLIDKR